MAQELYSPKERGALLTGWLAFIGLANAWTAYRYIDILRDFIQHSDTTLNGPASWAYPLLTVLALLNIGAVVALFKWRRFGLYLFIVTSGIALIVNVVLGIPLLLSLVGLIGVVLLWLILKPKWDYFR